MAIDFEALHDRYFDDVTGFIARRTGDSELARDLAQEAFVRAYRSRGSFDPTRPVWPWLSRIAHNLLINARRDERRRRARIGTIEQQAASSAPSFDDPEAAYTTRQLRLTIDEALAELSPRSRRILLMRCSEGCAYKEIADAEGMTNDAVKASLKRARTTFRVAFDRLSDEPLVPALWPLGRVIGYLRRLGADSMRFLQDASAAPLVQAVASTVAVAAIAGLLLVSPSQPRPHAVVPPRHPVGQIPNLMSERARRSADHSTVRASTNALGQEPVGATISTSGRRPQKRRVEVRQVDPPRPGGGKHGSNTGVEIPCSPSAAACGAVDTLSAQLP